MNSIKIGEKEYPFKANFTVLKKIGTLTGFKKLSELDTALTSLEVEHIPQVILWCIEQGVKSSGSKESVPGIIEIENELNNDFSLLVRAMEMIGKDYAGDAEQDNSEASGN